MKLKQLAAILALAILPAWGQSGTTYNLPNSSCSVQGTSYLYCSNMGTIRINGTAYEVYLSAVDIADLYQNPANSTVGPSSGSFNLENVNTLAVSTLSFTAGSYTNRHLTLNFGSNGRIDLDLHLTVYRGRYSWQAQNVVLMMD